MDEVQITDHDVVQDIQHIDNVDERNSYRTTEIHFFVRYQGRAYSVKATDESFVDNGGTSYEVSVEGKNDLSDDELDDVVDEIQDYFQKNVKLSEYLD